VLMFIADNEKNAYAFLSRLREKIGADLELYDKKEFKFVWVSDFPLFEKNGEGWDAAHHMFSMPKEEFVDKMEEDPGAVIGDLWDLTLNGVELASGSIRVSNPSIQKRIMEIVGFPEEEAYRKFGFLLDAYKYGGPSHGGMGLGVDRILALALGYSDIREVIAFPKNKQAECPMDGSPGILDEKQIKELHIIPSDVAKKNVSN